MYWDVSNLDQKVHSEVKNALHFLNRIFVQFLNCEGFEGKDRNF